MQKIPENNIGSDVTLHSNPHSLIESDNSSSCHNISTNSSKQKDVGNPNFDHLNTDYNNNCHNNSSDSDCNSDAIDNDDSVSINYSYQEKILHAISMKDRGNVHFKNEKFNLAIKSYKKGLKFVKKENAGDDKKLSDLKINLNLNMSICHARLKNWTESINAANEVLKIDPNHIKGLFRRGYARSQFDFLDEAKKDLVHLLTLDPSNVDAKKELNNVNKRSKEYDLNSRKAYEGIFNRPNLNLYDYENEMKIRKKKEEEEEKRKLREMWHSEMNKLKNSGEPEMSFDDWQEERKRKLSEEEDRKKQYEEERKRLKEERDSIEAERRNKSDLSSKSNNISTDDFDEEDKKILLETKKMGYCYFRKELTEEEKKLKELNRPIKLDDIRSDNTDLHPTIHNDLINNLNGKSKGISMWNSKGTTFEEKDLTRWAKETLTTSLSRCSAASNNDQLRKDPSSMLDLLKDLNFDKMNAKSIPDMDLLANLSSKLHNVKITTKEVKDINGDAHICIIRGTKRHIFDFNFVLSFEIDIKTSFPDLLDYSPMNLKNDLNHDSDNLSGKNKNIHKYQGEIHVAEVSPETNSGNKWLKDSKVKFDKEIRPDHKKSVEDILIKYKEAIGQSITTFSESFKEKY